VVSEVPGLPCVAPGHRQEVQVVVETLAQSPQGPPGPDQMPPLPLVRRLAVYDRRKQNQAVEHGCVATKVYPASRLEALGDVRRVSSEVFNSQFEWLDPRTSLDREASLPKLDLRIFELAVWVSVENVTSSGWEIIRCWRPRGNHEAAASGCQAKYRRPLMRRGFTQHCSDT